MYTRTNLLVGSANVEKIKAAQVAVFGLGGVGSYVAESLARSGVGKLILIDADVVVASNINRQLPALNSTLGQAKTEVVRQRLLDINPQCQIEIITKFYYPGDFEKFIPQPVDCIVDAIDSLPSKQDLILAAQQRGIKIYSSMGMGNKLDPTQIKTADISKTHTCALAKKLRSNLKKQGLEKGLTVVFSTEKTVINPEREDNTIASMTFVPATAGLLLGSLVVRQIIDTPI